MNSRNNIGVQMDEVLTRLEAIQRSLSQRQAESNAAKQLFTLCQKLLTTCRNISNKLSHEASKISATGITARDYQGLKEFLKSCNDFISVNREFLVPRHI